jgi:hypothetical protein
LIVRPFTQSDLDAFRKIHAASGLDYRFPDLSSPLFLNKTVIERDGKPTTLLAGKIDIEAYLMTSGTAKERLEDIEMVQPVFLRELWLQGIDSAYCGVPKSVDRHFRKHMERLGWERGRPEFVNYFRNV